MMIWGIYLFFAKTLFLQNIFKGIVMQLPNVSSVISVEYLIFTIFFIVVQLTYKPSNFARANWAYDSG